MWKGEQKRERRQETDSYYREQTHGYQRGNGRETCEIADGD